MAVKIFRWKAIGPLALLLVLVALLTWLFAEPIAKDTTEEVGTELLGTQVDVGSLDIEAGEASVAIGALEIADPFDSTRNLVEAAQIRLKLNPLALAEKKFVVDSFRLGGMRFGTTRRSPARPVKGDGFAPQALRSVRQWAQTVRRAHPQAHADRHGQAAGAEPIAAHHGALGPGAGGTGRFGAERARSLLPAARRLRHGGYRQGAGDPPPRHRRPRAGDRRHPARHRGRAREPRAAGGREAAGGDARAPGHGRGRVAHRGAPDARRGAPQGLRVRAVAPPAAVVLGAGDRPGILREGQHRPLPAGALLHRAGAPLHAAGTAAQARSGSPAAPRLGPNDSVPQGTRVAQVPHAARADRPGDRGGQSAPRRLRGGGAGADVGPVALRATDAGPLQPPGRRQRHRLDGRASRDRPRAP